MARLDDYEIHPDGMDEYLQNYGYHFSKKMCEWAVSKMRDRNGRRVQMRPKQAIDDMFKGYGIMIENDNGYDSVFSFHMALSDYVGSSIVDELAAARYVKDTIDDKDGYDGIVFCRFIADCNGKGVPIIWEDMI